MWEKHHLHLDAECAAPFECNSAAYFKEAALPTTDPTYIARDPVYVKNAHPSAYGDTSKPAPIQQRFLDTVIAKDRRYSYVSAKYPWIEAVHAFQNPCVEHSTYNDQASIARFAIPARSGDGNYRQCTPAHPLHAHDQSYMPWRGLQVVANAKMKQHITDQRAAWAATPLLLIRKGSNRTYQVEKEA